MIIGRRKFFSFFGTGVAMLAAPELFIPKKEIAVVTADQFAVWHGGEVTWEPLTMEALMNGSFNLRVVYTLAE